MPPPPPDPRGQPLTPSAWGASHGPTATKAPRILPTVGPGIGVAAAGAALAFNFSLQGRIDSFATLLAVTVVAAIIFARSERVKPVTLIAGAAAVAAAAVTVLRASPWVVIPAVMVWVSCLIIASQASLFATTGLMAAIEAYLLSVRDAVAVMFRSATGGRSPSKDRPGSTSYSGDRARVIRGLVAAIAVLIPLTWLLASADAAFGRLVDQVFQGDFFAHLTLTAFIVPAVLAIAIGASTAGHPAASTPLAGSGGRLTSKATMIEGTIVLGAVAALLGLWGATQVVVALGGGERLLATANLTAAANARQGFFQLVAVTALLVLVIIAVDRLVARTGGSEHRRFLVLTSIIGIETVGVAIATYARLSLYVDRFGNTMLRTSVAWFLGWLVVVMAVLIVTVNRRSPQRRSPVGPMFLLACVWVIAFGLFNPEAYVARRNIERRGDVAVVLDLNYLSEDLGTDAMPTIVDHLSTLDPATQAALADDVCSVSVPETEYGPLGWNRSASAASAAQAELGCEAFRP